MFHLGPDYSPGVSDYPSYRYLDRLPIYLLIAKQNGYEVEVRMCYIVTKLVLSMRYVAPDHVVPSK
jgi:hypothetical protein